MAGEGGGGGGDVTALVEWQWPDGWAENADLEDTYDG